jgi:hypothetical protein
MRDIRFVLTCLCGILCCSFAQAQISQSKAGYTIFVKYKRGQVINQTVAMQAVGRTDLKSSSQFITKCLDIDKNGIATLEVSIVTKGKVQTKKKMKVDRHGKPIGSSIEGYSGTFDWPDKPTKVGQSWVGNINMANSGQNNGGSIRSTYKLAGIKTVNGVKLASIAAALSVGGNFDVTGTGMIYVRFSDGQIESADFNLGLKQFSESNTQARLKLLMTIRAGK